MHRTGFLSACSYAALNEETGHVGRLQFELLGAEEGT